MPRESVSWMVSFRIMVRKDTPIRMIGGLDEQELEATDGEFHETGKTLTRNGSGLTRS